MTRQVKIGAVGCGVVASAYYLPFLMDHPEADLVAVCDLSQDRVDACKRLFGAREGYTDFYEMLEKADVDAVWILTGPGTHKPFSVAAAEAGKHILLQKPMATNKPDADAIQAAVKRAGVKCLVEPSQQSPLHPPYARLRSLVRDGALGDPYYFTFIWTGPDHDTGGLGHNPYGAAAFLTKESGGILYDYAYGPNQIVSIFGPCKSVMAMSALQMPERSIVPESDYTEFLKRAKDPWNANYWDAVVKAPKTDSAHMDAPDTYNILYEMHSGWIGMFHVGRPFHPIQKACGRARWKFSAPKETSISIHVPASWRRSIRRSGRCWRVPTRTAGWTSRRSAICRRRSGRSLCLAASTTTTRAAACSATRS